MSNAGPGAAMRVVIIGAGFSGALTAVQLLRAAGSRPLQLLLIERRARMARGLAYSTSDDNLLLNVPAGNMSALADEPTHFLDYCRAIDPSIDPGSFISRRIYGDYLVWTLRQAERDSAVPLTRLHGEAVAVRRLQSPSSFAVELADGQVVGANRVVLAHGYSACKPLLLNGTASTIDDGWEQQTIESDDDNLPIVIIGSGLTAIDTAFRLTSRNDTCKLLLVSRRGHLPRSHRTRPHPPAASEFPAYLQSIPLTALAHLRAIRHEVALRTGSGGNWRDVINELRPYTPELWQHLPPPQRSRFLVHLATYWDIHRHRLAPIAAQRLRSMQQRGQLQIVAGRIRSIATAGNRVQVEIRERATGNTRALTAAAVINCTGPNFDIDNSATALIAQLRDDGYLCADSLKMGLQIDDAYRPIGRDGNAIDGLHYLGPMLRARYWEAMAVPELRVHARALAQRIIESL